MSTHNHPQQPKQNKKVDSPNPPGANHPSIPKTRPDKLSLDAYNHIQACLNGKNFLEDESITAILRLSQYLRVFGLLAAVGYINQAKEGKIVERTIPMWLTLLSKCMNREPNKQELMQYVTKLARENPKEYMAYWRLSLSLSNYWNFWARAYKNGE